MSIVAVHMFESRTDVLVIRKHVTVGHLTMSVMIVFLDVCCPVNDFSQALEYCA